MNQLLWTNLLRQWVATELVALPLAIPVVGVAISAFLALSPVQNIVLKLLDTQVVWKLFYILVRWGVFTSIDWQEDSIYNAYEKQASNLFLYLGGKPDAEWTAADEKNFADAAANLIQFHLRGA